MSFKQRRARKRFSRLIDYATGIIYSEKSDFPELVTEVAFRYQNATLDEIHLAVQSVTRIEGELQKLVFSKYDIRDDAVYNIVVNEALTELENIENAESDELQEALRDICALRAEKAFYEMRMAFALESLESEETFAGAVYKAKKINNGPITIEERRTFKRLTDQLAEANEKIRKYDEELAEAGVITPERAERIVRDFYDVLVAQENVKLMDASHLPFPREEILEASSFLTEYLVDLRENDPSEFERLKCDVLLRASQTLDASLMLFHDIEPEDSERVADLNDNWRQVEDRIRGNEADDSDQQWMQKAKRLIAKYQLREG